MKKFDVFFFILFYFSITSNAQAPQAIPYQAVARDNVGNPIANMTVSLRFTIHDATAAGIIVYQETQSKTTNSLGLFMANIGNGTVVSGTFTIINWAGGSKFMQVEMDATGLTTYIDMGTQQLLSVPYALYAGSAPGTTTVTAISGTSDPNGATISGNALTLTPANGSNGGVVTTGTQTFAGTKTFNSSIKIIGGTQGAGKVLTSDAVGLASWTTLAGTGVHFIGESYGGGIVFYVYDNGLHGLIAATADQSIGIGWAAGSYTNTMAYAGKFNACLGCLTTSGGIGGGRRNTDLIIASQGIGNGTTYAARICNEYSRTVSGVTYEDWYLPSIDELGLLYLQKNIVGGFFPAFYWSSTEKDSDYAWFEDFSSGVRNANVDKAAGTYRVRAVRAF